MSEHTKEAEKLYRIVKGSRYKDLGIEAIEAYRDNIIMLIHDDAIDTISALQAQRDELLAALQMALADHMTEPYLHPLRDGTVEAIRCAIANAENPPCA